MIRAVSVFGTGKAKPGDKKYVLAEQLGRLLAESGFAIANGGYGGTGTLLELAFVWELKNKGFLSGDKPIILLGDYWGRLVELVAADDADSRQHLWPANEPKEVIELLKNRRRNQ